MESLMELVREGVSLDEIVRKYYPDITEAELRDCVQYVKDFKLPTIVELAQRHDAMTGIDPEKRT